MTNNIQLLLCPFCGGKATVSKFPGAHNVWCENQPVKCGNRTMYTPEQWNTRAPAEDVRAVVEEPVMRLECEKLWGGDGEYAVDFVKSGWLEECRQKGGTFLLYRHPQRPVVLPERFNKVMQYLLGEGDLDGYYFRDAKQSSGKYWWRAELRACLDAFEELNK